MNLQYATRDVLVYLRTCYPILLLITFVVAFISDSIFTAKRASQNGPQVQTGPGGRPLPKRARSALAVTKQTQKFSEGTKIFFRWLAVGVLLTLVADAAINMAHVIYARSYHWWCGQSVVVGLLTRKKRKKKRSKQFPHIKKQVLIQGFSFLFLFLADLHRWLILYPCRPSRVLTRYNTVPESRPIRPMAPCNSLRGGHLRRVAVLVLQRSP